MTSPQGSPMPSNHKEVDDVPVIFQLVEKCSWDDVVDRIHEEPSDASLLLELPSGQSNLAIHEACKQQPTIEVIQALVKANPASVMVKGQWGYLPIHYACSSGASAEVVSALIQANPSCVRSRDEHEHRLPVHSACKWGASEDVINVILTNHPEGIYLRDRSGMTPMDHAKSLPPHQRDAALKALGQGHMFCSVSKAVHQRLNQVENRRKREVATAHAKEIAELEAKHLHKLEVTNMIAEQERDQLMGEKAKLEANVDALNSRVSVLEKSEQALMEREEALEKKRQSALDALKIARSNIESLQTEVADLAHKLKVSNRIVKIHEERNQALSKWATSFAYNVQTWEVDTMEEALQKEHDEELHKMPPTASFDDHDHADFSKIPAGASPATSYEETIGTDESEDFDAHVVSDSSKESTSFDYEHDKIEEVEEDEVEEEEEVNHNVVEQVTQLAAPVPEVH